MSKSLNIVVVDDSDFTRQATSKILTDAGHNVVAQFSGGEDCMRYLHKDGSADVYVVDVVMPNISGIELAQAITDNIMDANIIMVSSLDSENILIEAISNGAVDFLRKPFEEADLLQSVKKIAQNLESKGL